MRIIIKLLTYLFLGPVEAFGKRHRENIVEASARTAFEFVLAQGNVDLVVVDGVQSRRRRRGHPSGRGTGLRVADLRLQHSRHHVGHGPHALADLGLALQPAFESGIDVPVLIGLDPGGGLHVALADHGAGFHGSVDFIARAIEKARVDEADPVLGGADAFLEVDRGAPLLVHDAHLESTAIKAEHVLHTGEQLA